MVMHSSLESYSPRTSRRSRFPPHRGQHQERSASLTLHRQM